MTTVWLLRPWKMGRIKSALTREISGTGSGCRRWWDAAKARRIPIRVGVNSGSLEKEILEKYGGVTAEGLVESALDKVHLIEEMGWDQLVISIKSSDVMMCVKAHELIAGRTDYPLHVGITEAGTVYAGNIKSSVGLGIILHEGIGGHDSGFPHRRSGGGGKDRQIDSPHAGAEEGRYRGSVLPHLRKDAD